MLLILISTVLVSLSTIQFFHTLNIALHPFKILISTILIELFDILDSDVISFMVLFTLVNTISKDHLLCYPMMT